ncbi:MAG TPA: RNA methyltransferase [Solirubrobacteraceae bacterium]|nr:RNA methyltransferase [Solirubrobacteraceae bacterium]
MPPITSPHNQKLKEIRKLRMRRREREREGRFVAEGEDLLAAADAAGWEPLERFCAAGSALPGIPVEPQLLAGASGLASGTRALAVYAERWLEAPVGPVCVHLHGVQDPGNVGTILRSAAAFGAGSVSIGPGTADPFSPKAVRASMGAVFEVPLARVTELTALPGTTIALVTDPAAAKLWQIASEGTKQNATETTLLIGAERDGLPPELVSAADHTARIPIHTHSLNAAMAATVALYEVTRGPSQKSLLPETHH